MLFASHFLTAQPQEICGGALQPAMGSRRSLQPCLLDRSAASTLSSRDGFADTVLVAQTRDGRPASESPKTADQSSFVAFGPGTASEYCFDTGAREHFDHNLLDADVED